MKNVLFVFLLLLFTSFNYPSAVTSSIVGAESSSENLFIILTDGFRWQEVFNGADSLLLNDEDVTPDGAAMKPMFWATTREERRKKLMPFTWNVIASKGQLFGNRELNNKMDVANLYSVSYPGYSEIFTGKTDIRISGNSKKQNPNINVLECLQERPDLGDKIAVFSSWDVFPYILNRDRNGLKMNCGYEQLENSNSDSSTGLISLVQEKGVFYKSATRHDLLTYTVAKDYIKKHQPRIVVIGFGETDDFAHQKRYDLYLQQANQVDRMIGELWNLVQTTPGYRNKTSFLITTDHGRGNNEKHWSGHGYFISGSSQTWLAMLGPNISPLGERKDRQQLYSRQLAKTIAVLAGKSFELNNASGALSKK